jgi:hypothetical protein
VALSYRIHRGHNHLCGIALAYGFECVFKVDLCFCGIDGGNMLVSVTEYQVQAFQTFVSQLFGKNIARNTK